MWYRAISLRYARIQSSGIILTPWATSVLNFVSFAACVAGETRVLIQSLTAAYLMLREQKLALRNIR